MSGTALTGEEIDALVATAEARGHARGMAEMADKLLSADITTPNVLAGAAAAGNALRVLLLRDLPWSREAGELARVLGAFLTHLGAGDRS